MPESQSARDGQVQLTDLDYGGHIQPESPVDRVTADIDSAEDFYACDEGNALWIDGTEYVVITKNFGFFHSPLTVVGEDDTQGQLIGGTLSQTSSTAGVAWARDLPESDDDRDPQRSDLIATFDRIYRLETGRLDLVHAWTPGTDHRECPACDAGRSGDPLRIEQQAGKAVELRQCTKTDCKHAYRYVRPFPEPDTATLLVSAGSCDAPSLTAGYTTSDTVEEYTLSGVFRCTEQDDFKFPIETNNGRDDGFWTASEVAAFCNPKLDNEDPDERFGTVTVTTNGRTGGTVIRWRDKPGARAEMTIEFQELTDDRPDYDRAFRWHLDQQTFATVLSTSDASSRQTARER